MGEETQRERKIYLRCFPLASVESMVLAVNDLSFPEGHYLRIIPADRLV